MRSARPVPARAKEMALSEIYSEELAESGEQLSASVRQLEALTALAAAPR